MNDLVVKKVDLCGDAIMAAQDKDGQVWAGVRWLCEGLGLSRGQMNNESAKIKEDVVLGEGARNLVLPTRGGKQEVLCLRHDFVPLWIAKLQSLLP
ncbi:phage antirepressor N-terminal domain-containing protein [Enterocloster citroniae]